MTHQLSHSASLPPTHVAIIMDGNGRWAQKKGLARIDGHRRGVDNVKNIVKAAQKANIRYLTLYAFSAENWNRPQKEVDALMNLLASFLKSQRKEMVGKKIRLHTIGRTQELPPKARNELEKTLKATQAFDDYHLVLALNYGSRTELLDAIERYQKDTHKPSELTWDTFSKYLDTGNIPDPDLIIRTSGEVRVSNFLLMQSAYSEYYFTSTPWPEFTETHFKEALESYHQRERRFGLTGEQINNT